MHVRRFADNPIIRPELLPGEAGANINGPSLIRVPDWVARPLARYHLYFAHHSGDSIRLALADRLEGPWRIHPGGVLNLAEIPVGHGHLASPDLIIDEARRELRMYFHAPVPGGRQSSFVATSTDGLHWLARPPVLGPFYFRVFRRGDAWYAFAKGGDLYRSPDGLEPFALVGNPFAPGTCNRPDYNAAGDIRHLAVDMHGDELVAWYTRIGDAPERILRQRILLAADPAAWRAAPAEEMLRPELPWEGADLAVVPSRAGSARGREHALRDPALFREDGRLFLVYSIAGESGLAIAEVV